MAKVNPVFGVNCLLLARYFFQMSSPNRSMTRKRKSFLPLVCIPEPMNFGTPRWDNLCFCFHSSTDKNTKQKSYSFKEENLINRVFLSIMTQDQRRKSTSDLGGTQHRTFRQLLLIIILIIQTCNVQISTLLGVQRAVKPNKTKQTQQNQSLKTFDIR